VWEKLGKHELFPGLYLASSFLILGIKYVKESLAYYIKLKRECGAQVR